MTGRVCRSSFLNGAPSSRLSPLPIALGVLAVTLAGAIQVRGEEVPFTAHEVSTNALAARSVFAADLDGDGDADVLSASNADDRIAWYENDGDIRPTFTQRLISVTADGATCVFAADLNGDGEIDVLSASFLDDKIAWYCNDGELLPKFTERVISTAADGAQSVFVADGDGDMDVLSASSVDSTIACYESDGGSPPSFAKRPITTVAGGAASVFAADVDGDGNTDVLSVSLNDDTIEWYESNGASPPT